MLSHVKHYKSTHSDSHFIQFYWDRKPSDHFRKMPQTITSEATKYGPEVVTTDTLVCEKTDQHMCLGVTGSNTS